MFVRSDPVQNPDLVKTMRAMLKEPSEESQAACLDLMRRARFLSPASISPAPQTGGVLQYDPGDLKEGVRVHFYTVQNKEKQTFLPVFTDWDELRKWNKNLDIRAVVSTFEELSAIVTRETVSYNGFVINPMGENVIFLSRVIARLQKERKVRGEEATPLQDCPLPPLNEERGPGADDPSSDTIDERDEPLQLPQEHGCEPEGSGLEEQSPSPRSGRPTSLYPSEMVEAVSALLRKNKQVRSAHLVRVVRESSARYLIVVDSFLEDYESLFAAIRETARPFLCENEPLDLLPIDDAVGQKAIVDIEPFYKRRRFLGLF